MFGNMIIAIIVLSIWICKKKQCGSDCVRNLFADNSVSIRETGENNHQDDFERLDTVKKSYKKVGEKIEL